MKLEHITFYQGHKGPVLSLAGCATRNYFFSSGSDGLIVRWSLETPDEGQVLQKVTGLVPTLFYNEEEHLLYAALNQKGIVIIDAETGKTVDQTAIPATSFGSILGVRDFIISNSKAGEILVVEKKSLKVLMRINTGLNKAPSFAHSAATNAVFYLSSTGLGKIDLMALVEEKGISFDFSNEVLEIAFMDNMLLLLLRDKFYKWSKRKRRPELVYSKPEGSSYKYMLAQSNAPALLTVSEKSEISDFYLNLDPVAKYDTVTTRHNDDINDLIWTENHRFVVSAGNDRKIGIWQFN